tara:strand:+ start:1054 stop:1494 length:441 start_codon:yes stop_codon:yes gene_type:complete
MFIECSNCGFKYLVNSADLKPNGRMVECANCNHQWFQDLNQDEKFSAVPSSKKENLENHEILNKNNENKNKIVKNLPSTVVRNENPSILNSILVIILIIFIFLGFWLFRSFETNTLVLIDFYIREFFFNLNLIISDLAKIIYNILN